jgi:hypothetical protein
MDVLDMLSEIEYELDKKIANLKVLSDPGHPDADPGKWNKAKREVKVQIKEEKGEALEKKKKQELHDNAQKMIEKNK